MPDRETEIDHFIAASEWRDAEIVPLAGDASNRRYLRLVRGGETAVLMDAPPEKDEDVRPFIEIAEYLCGIGLSAPRIFKSDEIRGLLLLEDLGDDLFARYIPDHPEDEIRLYSSATDVLSHLHRYNPPRSLRPYSIAIMTEMAALAFDWYLGGAQGVQTQRRVPFLEAVRDALQQYAPEQSVLIQRDYHSENLLWLPKRDGIARVGLLDFQDAMLGHPAYDLVSVLQDARRDVPLQIEAEMIGRYISDTNADPESFKAAYHCLGAQRNLRILGVFARLCLRDGKAHYVDLIPRVWDLLQRNLTHPALGHVAALVTLHLPEPTAEILTILKDKCAIIPTPS